MNFWHFQQDRLCLKLRFHILETKWSSNYDKINKTYEYKALANTKELSLCHKLKFYNPSQPIWINVGYFKLRLFDLKEFILGLQRYRDIKVKVWGKDSIPFLPPPPSCNSILSPTNYLIFFLWIFMYFSFLLNSCIFIFFEIIIQSKVTADKPSGVREGKGVK